MDDDVQRETARHKPDPYKQAQMQWMSNPQTSHQLKDNMKIMSLIAERDSAFQEMSIAFAEKKAALAERDIAFLQRDAALSDRNSALSQRDHALSALHQTQTQTQTQTLNPKYFPPNLYTTNNGTLNPKPKRAKKDPSNKKKQNVLISDNQSSTRIKNQEWKAHEELGLNQVQFDESTMPVPVCSCTGKYHQCYKWGEGGWQSSCCTLTMNVHPLPVMANKKHARMSGRKMSGGVFRRLLSRMADEGWDLGVPVDLKEHWSRHGTNRYITIK